MTDNSPSKNATGTAAEATRTASAQLSNEFTYFAEVLGRLLAQKWADQFQEVRDRPT